MTYKTKYHCIIFVVPTLLICLGFLSFLFLITRKVVGFYLFVALLILLLIYIHAYLRSTFKTSHNLVFIKTGVWQRDTISLDISEIKAVDVSQTVFGALLNYGTIILTTNNNVKKYIYKISEPLTCRRHIERLINYE